MGTPWEEVDFTVSRTPPAWAWISTVGLGQSGFPHTCGMRPGSRKRTQTWTRSLVCPPCVPLSCVCVCFVAKTLFQTLAPQRHEEHVHAHPHMFCTSQSLGFLPGIGKHTSAHPCLSVAALPSACKQTCCSLPHASSKPPVALVTASGTCNGRPPDYLRACSAG